MPSRNTARRSDTRGAKGTRTLFLYQWIQWSWTVSRSSQQIHMKNIVTIYESTHQPLASNQFLFTWCLFGVAHTSNGFKIIQMESTYWKNSCGKIVSCYLYAKKLNTSVYLMKVSLLGLFKNHLATPHSRSASIITRARHHCCWSTLCGAKCKTRKNKKRFLPKENCQIRSFIFPFPAYWHSSLDAVTSKQHRMAAVNSTLLAEFP